MCSLWAVAAGPRLCRASSQSVSGGRGARGSKAKMSGPESSPLPLPSGPCSQAPPLEAPALEDTAQRPSPPVCLTQAPRPSSALVFCHWAPALGRSLGWGRPLSGPWCRANRHVARVAATLQARQGDPAEATSPSGSKSECGLCRWSPGPLPRTAPRQERKEDELKVPQRSLVGPSGWCGHSCPSASRSRRVEWAMPAPGPERPPVLLGDPRSGQRAQKAERQGLDAGGWASGGRPPAALPSLHPGGRPALHPSLRAGVHRGFVPARQGLTPRTPLPTRPALRNLPVG